PGLVPVSSRMECLVVRDGPLSGVWLGGAFGGFGAHIFFGLPDDRAAVQVEVRIHNPTLADRPYGGSISVAGMCACQQLCGGIAWRHADRGVGLGLWFEPGVLEDGCLEGVWRFGKAGDLMAPRQLDVWSFVLTPYASEEKPLAISREVIAWAGHGNLILRSVAEHRGAKAFLQMDSGQTLESEIDLDPVRVQTFDGLPGLPVGIVIRSDDRELLSSERTAPEEKIEPESPVQPSKVFTEGIRRLQAGLDPTEHLARAAFNLRYRAAAYSAMGLWSLRCGEPDEAASWFEDALLYNAEDHLTWWYKAVAHRLSGDQGEDRPELPNAHYLAPLEPALRVESFMRLPVGEGTGPNPLLTSVGELPERYIHVAELYFDAGLFDQAARWLDEALRHVDIPVFRYQLAYCFLEGSRMKAEAAEQVRRASLKPLDGMQPSPRVAARLLREFPRDERLRWTCTAR
ncbi:MAG: hypothetical protein WAO58_04250, partial [Fimbriimonadaceae bacterium]